tara:strand:+ start:562 stop:867 length:306 start_codon:yes stop_codon:yes gene_type:complete
MVYALTTHDNFVSDASGNPARNWGKASEIMEVSIAIMKEATEATANVSHAFRGTIIVSVSMKLSQSISNKAEADAVDSLGHHTPYVHVKSLSINEVFQRNF